MSTEKGKASEDTAAKILQKLDYKIIKRNYLTRYGEIDIIGLKLGKIHIIEVKSTYGQYDPSENFHKTKLKRLLKTASAYCFMNNIDPTEIQIDLFLIDVRKKTYSLIESANLYFH